MSSPVDTSVKHFTSAMTAAPALSGTAGALINILDACLVTGFDAKSATSLVVASGVATLSFTGTHSATVDSVIFVENASVGLLNGEQRVTSVAAGVVRFATAAANGTTTGAVTFKMAPAGWAKTFTGVNLAAYKSLSVEATGCLLRVDDMAAQFGRVRGFESMADIATGSGLFPSAVQFAAPGLWWSKSNAADATARPWVIFADDRGVYFCPRPALAAQHQANYFGDVLSLKSGDPYGCALRANVADRSAATTALGDDVGWVDNTSAQDGLYLARAANALGGAVRCFSAQVIGAGLSANSSYAAGSVGWPYPAAADNGLMLSPVAIYNAQGYRGYVPGLRMSPQVVNASFTTGDVVAGMGDMAGRKVMVMGLGAASGTGAGEVFFDHVANWRT